MPRVAKNSMDEETFIAELLRPLATETPARHLQDDGACLRCPAGYELAVTTDMLLADIHFLRDGAPEDIAFKALAVNLSDLAAMGAEPYAYQLAMSLTPAQDREWLERFTDELSRVQQHYGCFLSGGDTVRGGELLILSITAHGLVPEGEALHRSGAVPGDVICATGTIGDAALGLAHAGGMLDIDEAHGRHLQRRYWRPEPRLLMGPWLRGRASACLDISDGLLMDCQRLCTASGAGAVLELEALPLSQAAKAAKERHPALFPECLSAGDDYELLFTLPAETATPALLASSPVTVTPIGVMTEGAEATLRDGQGQAVELISTGYSHC